MEKFETKLEKELFEMYYKCQLALAKLILQQTNIGLLLSGRENEWPAQKPWNGLAGSSKALFLSRARELSNIDDDKYLELLRNNIDALIIAEELGE